jgi:hypothetical protein
MPLSIGRGKFSVLLFLYIGTEISEAIAVDAVSFNSIHFHD